MKPLSLVGTAVAALLVSVCAHAEDIAARVNGVPITESQVTDMSVQIARSDNGAQTSAKETREVALQSLIDIEVLTQQAKAEKIVASPEEVDEQLNKIKGRFPSPEAFAQALEANQSNETDLRKDISNGLVMQKLVDRHLSVKLPPDAVQKFYKDNPDKFQHPAEVRASHIFFPVSDESGSATAKKHADEALARLKKGEDFGKLAQELSGDSDTAQEGGDLGFFARDTIVQPLADAAFSLKKGEISGVVETKFGFHIIKVTDTRAPGLTPLTDVQAQIERYLTDQERAKQAQAYVQGLRKTAKIEIVEATAK